MFCSCVSCPEGREEVAISGNPFLFSIDPNPFCNEIRNEKRLRFNERDLKIRSDGLFISEVGVDCL